jgi:hypothetical protein
MYWASIAQVTADAVGFSEGVVQCRIECACRHLGAELGNWLGQLHLAGHFGGGLQVFRFKLKIDIDGMRRPGICGGDGADISCQLLHGFQRLIEAYHLGEKRPGVPKRHRAKASGLLA